MQVRSARVDDVDQVIGLVRHIVSLHSKWDAARFGARRGAADMYRDWLAARATDETSVFLVADRNDDEAPASKIVAFLVGTLDRNVPIYRVERYGFVHDVWVEPDYRHEGLGQSMTLLMLERFKAIGAEQVRLDTAACNEPARKLFERCGFRPSTIEMLCEL